MSEVSPALEICVATTACTSPSSFEHRIELREVVYAFDLPGIRKDQISIKVKDENLTISAERAKTEETNEDGFYRLERRYGTFASTKRELRSTSTAGARVPHGIRPAMLEPCCPKRRRPGRSPPGYRPYVIAATMGTSLEQLSKT
jgi:hypothetical protein